MKHGFWIAYVAIGVLFALWYMASKFEPAELRHEPFAALLMFTVLAASWWLVLFSEVL